MSRAHDALGAKVQMSAVHADPRAMLSEVGIGVVLPPISGASGVEHMATCELSGRAHNAIDP